MNKRTTSSMIKCFVLLTLLLPAWLVWDVSPAQGAGFLVTRFDDPTPGTCQVSDCSLREAVIQANSTLAYDEIYLPEGVYNLTRFGYDETAAAGDLDITNPVYIWGFGAPETVVINGTGDDRVFEIVGSPGTVTIESVKVTNGLSPTLDGGGIACANSTLELEYVIITSNDAPNTHGGGLSSNVCTVTMNATSIINNNARFGGGIYAGTSTYTITNSDISSNFADTGGGIYSFNSNINLFATSINGNISEGSGGGLFQLGSSAILSIDKSLVANNVANSDGGGINVSAGSNLSINNSTISNNVTKTYGGGIATRIPTTITHSTIVLNSADFDVNGLGGGGGIDAYEAAAVVSISHTILANNQDFSPAYYNDCNSWYGAMINSNGYNLVRAVGNCTFSSAGDILGLDPRLGLLQNNGGWTDTHALLIGSPAIDAGNPTLTIPPAPSTDQRGPSRFARIINGRVDIGAFESWKWSFLPVIFK